MRSECRRAVPLVDSDSRENAMRTTPKVLFLALGGLAAGANPAFAAGLPQLDPATYPPQIVWLVIAFAILYVLMWRVALPRVGQVLEDRQRRIEGNLKKAEAFKADAEAAAAAYDKAMTDARAAGQEVLREARERIAADAAERHETLGEKLNAQIAAAEERIAQARTEAVASIRDVAVDVTVAAVAKLVESDVERGVVADIVDQTMKERA